MKVDYEGRTYTVGRRYKIKVPAYRLRTDNDDKRTGLETIWGKLVLKKYLDGEGYHDYDHFGFVFEYKHTWRGTEQTSHMTMPDVLAN